VLERNPSRVLHLEGASGRDDDEVSSPEPEDLPLCDASGCHKHAAPLSLIGLFRYARIVVPRRPRASWAPIAHGDHLEVPFRVLRG
jgi:hypothetical protein